MEILLVVVFGLLLYLSIAATVRLSRSDVYSRDQKVAQYLLIWLLPLIGPMLVLKILMEETGRATRHQAFSSLPLGLRALTFFVEGSNSSKDSHTADHLGSHDFGPSDGGNGGDGSG